jgi:hypothetical protein
MSRTGNHTFELETVDKDINGETVPCYKVKTIDLNIEDVRDGIEITWIAADTDFELWFPGKRNPLSRPWWCRRFSLKSKDKTIRVKLRRNFEKSELGEGCEGVVRGGRPGEVFYYSIYTAKNNGMVIGNSSPRMIIRF